MTPAQFSAEIADVKVLHNILKAISTQEYCIVRPMEEGLKLTVEDSRSSEVSVYVSSNTFSTYHVAKDEDVMFKVSLKVLTECLHIFGDEGTLSMKLSYRAPGSPLCLVMKHGEENITVDCQLSTMNVDDFREIPLADECNVNNIVFNGEQLVDKLSDLDMQADEFELKLSKRDQTFQIMTSSILGETTLDISKQSEMIDIFRCVSDFKCKYVFSNLRQILKVMAYASKVSVSTGESGLLGMQLVIKSDEGQMYAEYYMTALFEDD